MIITQTPFRVSFAGGGTDLAAFYEQGFGAVLSVAIKRHMYVTVHERFERNVRISYSKTEVAGSVDDIQHSLVREAMRLTGTDLPLEVTTIADVPAGTGLGSSSTLAVGLLNAFHAHRGRVVSAARLAAQACEIEITRLGHPIGKQDQYAAAFGGMNYIRFNPDDTVNVEPVPCGSALLRELEGHALMVYTEQQRSANKILSEQKEQTAQKRTILRTMRDLADEMRLVLAKENPDLPAFGRLLHEGWELKRSLGLGISNSHIDDWYEKARAAGAWGGKLLGAGGGGFLFLLAPPDRHAAVLEALGRPRVLPFEIDSLGSRIVFISDH